METARLTAEKIARLSESAGTPFTAEEYLKAVAESSEEMSVEQLDGVAGGVWAPSIPNIMESIRGIGVTCALVAGLSAIRRGDADKCQFG